MSVVPTDAQPCNEKLLSDLLNENTSDISPQSRNEAFLLGLINKVVPDITPVSRVECYLKALCEKNTGSYLTDKDLDTTLKEVGKAADAAAVGDALSALSEEIATETESKVSAHNTGTDAHSDIRLLIQGLTDRLNALADSDDTTLDQLSEVVAYIKSNRDLISAITTDKVSVADIVDDLTTNVANKPLSAAQGVVLKALIDAIVVPTVDDTLTVVGAAADSKAVGEKIQSLSEEIDNLPSGGTGLTTAEKTAMLSLFKSAAYTSDVSSTIASLETLWSGGGGGSGGGSGDSVSASYSNGDLTIGGVVAAYSSGVLSLSNVSATYNNGVLALT